jgi:hypothetical protein
MISFVIVVGKLAKIIEAANIEHIPFAKIEEILTK